MCGTLYSEQTETLGRAISDLRPFSEIQCLKGSRNGQVVHFKLKCPTNNLVQEK